MNSITRVVSTFFAAVPLLAVACSAADSEPSSDDQAVVEFDSDNSALMSGNLESCGCILWSSDGFTDTYLCPSGWEVCAYSGGGGDPFGGGGSIGGGSCSSCKAQYSQCQQGCCSRCSTMSCWGDCGMEFQRCMNYNWPAIEACSLPSPPATCGCHCPDRQGDPACGGGL